MPTPPPDDLLDRTLLRQMAGDAEFRKGENYHQAGAVRQVQIAGDRITAKVSGSRAYRVKLWRGRGQLQFSCNCDRGHEQEFCKHCVAVGLAWLAGPAGPAAKPGVTREELRDHLRGLDKERLINLALEAMDYDDILRRRLMLETIGVARPRKPDAPPLDLATYRQILREAIECADYVDYEAMPDYTQGVEEAIRPLGELLRGGYAAAVVDLAEFALVELDKANDMVDGGDGALNAAYDDLQHYHLEACRQARLNPEKLAARLLEFEIEGGLGVFNNTASAYAEILGEPGLLAWRRQLTQEWQNLPPASAARRADDIDHRRFQINALMERMASEAGDLDALAAIRQRDLTTAHDYLALAETYRAARQLDLAIAAAERGLAASGDLGGLRDFLSSAYLEARRPADAAALVWQQYEQTPELDTFAQLKSVSGPGWPAWRERALGLLRTRPLGPDRSPLVEALLSEGLVEEAWAEAKAGGCRVRLWLALADRRAAAAPDDALRIYQDHLNAIIAGGDQRAYRQAIEVLARIRRLLETLGRREDFGAISAEVRAAHRQKRNFLKLLDGMR